jgi:hypothetical protein
MSARFHSVLEERVAAALQAAGYPPHALVYEPVLLPIDASRSYQPDFGVLDPERNEFVAVIEVKGRSDTATLEQAAAQLHAYLDGIGNRPVAAFMATPSETSGAVNFYRLRINSDDQRFEPIDLPRYETLRSSALASSKTEARARLKGIADGFKVVSWMGSAFVIVLTGVDVYAKERWHISLLSPERLTLLGIAIALLLIPYAAKLKAFGIEFERAKREEGPRPPRPNDR